MSLSPLLTTVDIKNRYSKLLGIAGLTNDAALNDIAGGVIDLIIKELGYNPQKDSTTGLPQVVERLDGGKPSITLLAPVDIVSQGYVLTVEELGIELTPRLNYTTNNTGHYFIGEDGYTLWRLATVGGRMLGVWGVSTSNFAVLGETGGSGTVRIQNDYTDRYRGTIKVTYTPDVSLRLIKQVALNLCRLEILEIISQDSVSITDYSHSITFPDDFQAARLQALSKLPRPRYMIGTGGN